MELLKHSEALRLAELLELGPCRSGDTAIATELRRQHAVNAVLLEALKLVMPLFDMHDDCANIDATAKARKVAYAAIAKAEAA